MRMANLIERIKKIEIWGDPKPKSSSTTQNVLFLNMASLSVVKFSAVLNKIVSFSLVALFAHCQFRVDPSRKSKTNKIATLKAGKIHRLVLGLIQRHKFSMIYILSLPLKLNLKVTKNQLHFSSETVRAENIS